jgi:hypothetical protein
MNRQTQWRWRIVARLEVGIGRRIGRRILTRPLLCSSPLRTNRNSQCEGRVIIKIRTFAFVGCRVLFHNSQQSQVDKTTDHHCVFRLAFAERSSEAWRFPEASEGMGRPGLLEMMFIDTWCVLPTSCVTNAIGGMAGITVSDVGPPFSHSVLQTCNVSHSHAIRRFW